MITLPVSTLRVLGEHVALANSASFLWRKLSQSLTIQQLADHESPDALEQSLHELLTKENLGEDDETLAYCLLAALMMVSPDKARGAAFSANLRKVFWGARLAAIVGDNNANTTIAFASTPARIDEPALVSSAGTTRLVIE